MVQEASAEFSRPPPTGLGLQQPSALGAHELFFEGFYLQTCPRVVIGSVESVVQAQGIQHALERRVLSGDIRALSYSRRRALHLILLLPRLLGLPRGAN